MISVAEAQDAILKLVAPVATEEVALRKAVGRVLAQDAVATRDQPPFAGSAMDGYAVRTQDVQTGAILDVIGEAAAGSRFDGSVGPKQAVRIFTGAPVPNGADRIVIQEDVIAEAGKITIGDTLDAGPYIRPAGGDFKTGSTFPAGRRLTPAHISLLASMNLPQVTVARRPKIAILATGDELVMPGESPNPDQIVSSNGFGLAALLEQAGASVSLLPLARDTLDSLKNLFEMTQGSDLILTSGGASVGDHDLMAQMGSELGLDRAFYKVAMRPGKPLMAGKFKGTPLIGLPGNPVSAMVCGQIFVLPALRRLLGLSTVFCDTHSAPLAGDLRANGPREHYMRAYFDGTSLHVFDRQDSSLQKELAEANVLAVRAPKDPARSKGDFLNFIWL